MEKQTTVMKQMSDKLGSSLVNAKKRQLEIVID